MAEPGDINRDALDYDLLDPSETRQKSKEEFAWVAAFIIFGWSPLAMAAGAFVVGAVVLLLPEHIVSLGSVVYPVVIVVGFGLYGVTLIGLPILARQYHAGFWRGLAAVGVGILHAFSWALLNNVVLQSTFAAIVVDSIVATACATVIWRRWWRSAVVARLSLLGRFD